MSALVTLVAIGCYTDAAHPKGLHLVRVDETSGKMSLVASLPADNPLYLAKFGNILYANWRNTVSPEDIERIELLNPQSPFTDLQNRSKKTKKFAVVSRIPTPDNTYYPIPYYAALFNPNRSLEKASCHFLMTAIRKTALNMLDT